jgi:hypothetical protein
MSSEISSMTQPSRRTGSIEQEKAGLLLQRHEHQAIIETDEDNFRSSLKFDSELTTGIASSRKVYHGYAAFLSSICWVHHRFVQVMSRYDFVATEGGRPRTHCFSTGLMCLEGWLEIELPGILTQRSSIVICSLLF